MVCKEIEIRKLKLKFLHSWYFKNIFLADYIFIAIKLQFGAPNLKKKPKNMLLLKNPQISRNHYETWSK